MKELFPHQTDGFKYIIDRGGGFLFWKMRVGKTLAALHGVFNSKGLPILILTKSSIMETFRKALVEDMNINTHKIGVCHSRYSKTKRAMIAQDCIFVICNYEAAIPLRVMTAQRWRSIVFDESFALANIEAKVTRYIERSIKKQPARQVRVALTGTPASESPRQYASQFFIVDGHYLGYNNIHEYMVDNWIPDSSNRGKLAATPGHLKDIHKYIHENASFLSLEELGKGSEILYDKRYVDLNEKQLECIAWAQGKKKELNQLQHLIGGMQGGLGDMVYANYENMIASGINPVTREVINYAKINDVLECYLDNPEPLLVLSWFVDILPVATKIFNEAGVRAMYIDGTIIKTEAEEIRTRFQDGELDVIFAQSKVASEGLDFSNANLTYFLNNSFSLNIREQAVMRTTNINKKTPVGIIDMCTNETIDSKIVDKLNKKEKISDSFLRKYCQIT